MVMASSTSFRPIGGELICIQLREGKKCMADEQFHQANNKLDIIKKYTRGNKQTNKQQQNTKIQIVNRKQSKQILVKTTKRQVDRLAGGLNKY